MAVPKNKKGKPIEVSEEPIEETKEVVKEVPVPVSVEETKELVIEEPESIKIHRRNCTLGRTER